MLGDLVSLVLAAKRGVDPSPVPVIESLKAELGGSSAADPRSAVPLAGLSCPSSTTSQAPFAAASAVPVRRWSRSGETATGPSSSQLEAPKPPPAPVVLEAKDLAKVYGEGSTAVRALDGASLEVRKGEIVAIMGPSGSGKSTMLHLLGALETPSAGQISLGGERYDGLDDAGPHADPPRPDRLRLSVLQPAAVADGRGERAPAGADRRRGRRRRALALARAPRRRRASRSARRTCPPSSQAASSSASRSPAPCFASPS